MVQVGSSVARLMRTSTIPARLSGAKNLEIVCLKLNRYPCFPHFYIYINIIFFYIIFSCILLCIELDCKDCGKDGNNRTLDQVDMVRVDDFQSREKKKTENK